MSSTSTKWTTDTNTKSGTVQVYSSSVSVLKITADNDANAILDLFADQGDDNADKWRMWASASDNDLHFSNYTSGAWVDKLVIADGGTITIGGDLDVDGTTNLDVVDIDGAVQLDSTLTVGVNDTGYDVKFFGATATNGYMLWDESTDDLILGSASRLGIGTASPQSSLHIENSSTTGWADTVTYADYQLAIRNNTNTLYGFAGVAFDVSTETDADSISAAIHCIGQNTTAGDHRGTLSFATNNDDESGESDDALQERMRITSDGNVGIGTSSPATILEVDVNNTYISGTDGGDSDNIRFKLGDSRGNGGYLELLNDEEA